MKAAKECWTLGVDWAIGQMSVGGNRSSFCCAMGHKGLGPGAGKGASWKRMMACEQRDVCHATGRAKSRVRVHLSLPSLFAV